MPARSSWIAGGAAAAALTLALTGNASALTVSPPLATGLVGPLGLAVAPDGTAYVAETFRNAVSRVDRDGTRTDVLTGAQGVAGVQPQSDGSLVYTWSIGPGEPDPTAQLRKVDAHGKVSVLGHVGAYEKKANPDQVNSYGFQGLTPECASQVPPQIGGSPYTGLVDTDPYAIARLGGGAWAVADAGANAVFRVGPDQRVSTLAVLPPVPVTITAAQAGKLHLPSCVVGKTYDVEAVPTDVELGPDGLLYVSSLAGGPEDGSLGALGGVFTVDPASGAVKRIASGFAGAAGLAVGTYGRVYVTELYTGRISLVRDGAPWPVAQVPAPAAIEFAHGRLYVTVDAVPAEGSRPDGKLVTLDVSDRASY